MTGDEKDRAFLIELEALTRKHGIAVSGCGCCGSPRLDEVDVSDPRAGYANEGMIEWVAPSDDYTWEHRADKIIKAGANVTVDEPGAA